MRLTKYEPNKMSMFPYKLKDEELSTELDSIHKLGQLEDILEGHNIETLEELDGLLWYVKQLKDIEKDLGIDLITLFKAFKNGCYGIQNGKIYKMNIVRLDSQDKESIILFRNKHYGGECYLLKDYGKTWALAKEVLL